MHLPEVQSDMHRYVWFMLGLEHQKKSRPKKHGYLSVPDPVMIVAIALYTDTLGMPY